MATAKSKSVATRQATQVSSKSASELSAEMARELAADAGRGFEEANREAFAIPFLRILQDLSPQVKKKMAGYIEGAKPGQFFNTVSQELSDTLRVIPCHYTQSFIEWTPRDEEGQGFVAAHPPGSPIILTAVRNKKNKNVLPNGNILMDTRSHFVLIQHDDGHTEGALITMASSGIKVSRRWMSQMRAAVIEVNGRLIEPPMFAWSYLLTTEEEANEEGSWYQWVVSDRQRVTDPSTYRAAKAFGEQMKTSAVKVNYAESGHAPAGNDSPRDLSNEIDA